MKIGKKIGLFGIGFFFLGTVDVIAFSEEKITDKRIEFEAPDTPTGSVNGPFTIIKPGTYDKWITVNENQGKQTLGGQFRLSFVPNFDFGNVVIKGNNQYYSLKRAVSYKENSSENQENNYLPPFLQVLNIRGTEEKYRVNVSADNFSGTDINNETHTLKNTRIILKNFSVRNNRLDMQEEVSATNILNIPTNEFIIDKTSKEILSTVIGQGEGTESSISSLVFQNKYSKNMKYDDQLIESSKAVQLFVPARDTPKTSVNYSTTITWTLENAL